MLDFFIPKYIKNEKQNSQLFSNERKYINSCVSVPNTLKHESKLSVEQKVWSKTDWHSSELILKQSWQLNPLSIQMIDVSVKSCYLFHLVGKSILLSMIDIRVLYI